MKLNIEYILDCVSVVFSTVIMLSFIGKYLYNFLIIKDESQKHSFIDSMFRVYALVFDKNNLKILDKVPIFFYTPAVCSTSVIFVFSAMIRNCSEIHMPTLFISLFIFFTIATYIRFATFKILDGGHKISCMMNKMYLFSLLPVMIDATNCKQIVSYFAPNTNYHLLCSLSITAVVIVICLYISKFIKYLGIGTMLMFAFTCMIGLISFDSNILIGIFNLPNNKLTILSIINAICYASLFTIYCCDLFCICIENSLINYANNMLLKNGCLHLRDNFYALTSFLVSALSLLWLILFLNICNTNFIEKLHPIFNQLLTYATGVVFTISMIMQVYVLIDFIKHKHNKLYYLLLITLFLSNIFWVSYISYATVVIYLLSQLLTAFIVLKKITHINIK